MTPPDIIEVPAYQNLLQYTADYLLEHSSDQDADRYAKKGLTGPSSQAADLSRYIILLPHPRAAKPFHAFLGKRLDKDRPAIIPPWAGTLRDWAQQFIYSDLQREIISEHSRTLLFIEALQQYPSLFKEENQWQVTQALLQFFDELSLNQQNLFTTPEEWQQQLQQAYGIEDQNQHLLNESHLVYTLWHAWQQQLEESALIDETGDRFMVAEHPDAELAPRDIVARAIDHEMKRLGAACVYLDISHRSPAFIASHFPTIHDRCKQYGIDITREPIPVVPAAHYTCGGVVTDICGRTNIESLYVLGETGCTGLHGGNRLASNSLLEAVVVAHNAAEQCRKDWSSIADLDGVKIPAWTVGQAEELEECVLISHTWDQIRRLMWNFVGIVRSEKRLLLVRKQLAPLIQDVHTFFDEYLLTPDLIELRNIALVADLIVRCALSRKESRGLHYMVDYPEQDDENWRKNTVL